MTKIGITGVSGYIGTALVSFLEQQQWCEQVYGTDFVDPPFSEKLIFHKSDIRDPNLIDFWQDKGIDVMVHLAFIVDHIFDQQKMYDINVGGTLNILRICEALKIGHIIMASSATAYGAWPDNPVPLTEEDSIRVFPDSFPYAHHKGLNEGYFKHFMVTHPEVVFNIVRPCVVYGPHTENYLSRILTKMPFVALVDGLDPQMQFVHEDDVASFFALLTQKRINGAFNLAGDGTLRLSEIAKIIGKPTVKVPSGLLKMFFKTMWKLHIYVEAPQGLVDFMAYPWVVDTTRAKELLGWQPKYSSEETLRSMLASHMARHMARS